MKTSILTPEFRLSFADLFQAARGMSDNGAEGKLGFRAEMLFPKSIKMSELREMQELFNATVPDAWRAAKLEFRDFQQCFLNGDKKKQEGRKGNWMLRASSGADFQPRLLLEDRRVARPSDYFAGMYARAILSAFSWSHKNAQGYVVKRGVSFNLLTVQRTRAPLADGSDRFGNFVSAEEQDALLDAAPLGVEEGEDLLA